MLSLMGFDIEIRLEVSSLRVSLYQGSIQTGYDNEGRLSQSVGSGKGKQNQHVLVMV